jgi:hypothetical protein
MFRRSPLLVLFGLAGEQRPMGMKMDRDLIELARGNFNAEQIGIKLNLTPKTVIKMGRRLGVSFPQLEFKRNGRRTPTSAWISPKRSTRAAFISLTEQNWPTALTEAVHGRLMISAAAILTHEEFASLLTVGNTPVNGSAPVIPAAHRAHLIALGYMADIGGRLRVTTPGRHRMYAGQLAS